MYRRTSVIGLIGLMFAMLLVSCANKTGTDAQIKDMQKQLEDLKQQVGQTQQQTVPAWQVVPQQEIPQQEVPAQQAIPGQVIPEQANMQQAIPQQAFPQQAVPMQQAFPQPDNPLEGGPGIVTQATNISLNQAKQIAANDAGFDVNAVAFTKMSSDYDDGLMRWEIDFVVNTMKYEYEINSNDGTILKKEVEIVAQSGFPQEANPYQQTLGVDPTGQTGLKVSAERAKEIAIQHSGVDAANVILTKQEYDTEHATPRWEIEFVIGTLQYEYEISAVNGAVLKFKTKRFTIN